MNKEEYREYLQSNHWKNLRRQALEKAQYKCSKCGSRYCLNVHHLRYRNIYDVTVADLAVVCNYCHKKEHGIATTSRPIKPDTNHLLKGVYHKPIKPPPKKKEKRMGQAAIREIVKQNKARSHESWKLVKEQEAWARAMRRAQ